jgi:hypothetical protein
MSHPCSPSSLSRARPCSSLIFFSSPPSPLLSFSFSPSTLLFFSFPSSTVFSLSLVLTFTHPLSFSSLFNPPLSLVLTLIPPLSRFHSHPSSLSRSPDIMIKPDGVQRGVVGNIIARCANLFSSPLPTATTSNSLLLLSRTRCGRQQHREASRLPLATLALYFSHLHRHHLSGSRPRATC